MNKTILSLVLIFCVGKSIGQNRDSSLMNRSLSLPVQTLRADHYAKNMGFMCRKELQIQKAVKLPVYFRLGSLQYTNYLEGKSKLY